MNVCPLYIVCLELLNMLDSCKNPWIRAFIAYTTKLQDKDTGAPLVFMLEIPVDSENLC